MTGRDAGGAVKALEPAQPKSPQLHELPTDGASGDNMGNMLHRKPGEAIPEGKAAAVGETKGFVDGLDEGMRGLKGMKEDGPEGIDFAAEGGKVGVLGENIIKSETVDYKKVFFEKYPDKKGKVVVHHSVEQQVLRKYYGLFSKEEINKADSLRGIPLGINNEVHLSEIRREWNKFYKAIQKGEIAATKGNFIKKQKRLT